MKTVIGRTQIDCRSNAEFIERFTEPFSIAIEHYIKVQLPMFTLDYDRADWNNYALSNGGFYIAPDVLHVLDFNTFNKNHTFISGDAAGVVITLMALDDLIPYFSDDTVKRLYGFDVAPLVVAQAHLQEYAHSHREASAILALTSTF